MPSPRRVRLVILAAVALTVLFFFHGSGLKGSKDSDGHPLQDFYHKTKNAMEGGGRDRGRPVLDTQTGSQAGQIPADRDADGDIDDDDQQSAVEMQERLKAAEQKAKDNANEKAGPRPDPPSNVIGVGSSADGQKKIDGESGSNLETKVSQEELAAEAELNAILKKSPVIIFSKTYCPHSKRAKGILLEKYTITPEPYVVELDEHPLGSFLQDHLLEKTGRRTVPNILINGVSIGGADDVVALDKRDNLIAKVVDLGSNRVEMEERFVSGHQHA